MARRRASVQQVEVVCLCFEPTAIFHGPGARTSPRAAAPARPSRGSGMTREWAGGRSPSEISLVQDNQGHRPVQSPRTVKIVAGPCTRNGVDGSLPFRFHPQVSIRSNGRATCTKVFAILPVRSGHEACPSGGSLNNPPCGTRVPVHGVEATAIGRI